ncbi:MAG TPA: hypothetical protein VEL76_28955 [Gemmataceae bacterium]|nr:hypothetical protein [Gemmataceae bacterium]
MGLVSDFFQGIPLNAVLKERVTLAEQKVKDMEAETRKLKEQVAALTTENEQLKRQVSDLAAAQQRAAEKPEIKNGCYYFGDDRSKLYCVACYETQGKKHPMVYVLDTGYLCAVCQKVIPY